MHSDVVVLDPADFRGKRGPGPRHGGAVLFKAGCRCDGCVAGDETRRAKAVERTARWRESNPDGLREMRARHRDKHRAKRRADALAYYYKRMAEDPETVRAQRRDWFKTPKGQLANRLAAHKRRGAVPDREYAEIILGDPCSLCGGRSVEIDHIDPVALGGSGEWDNLTPLCRSCNASKNGGRLLVHLARTSG